MRNSFKALQEGHGAAETAAAHSPAWPSHSFVIRGAGWAFPKFI
jgi:hypothetical protein